MIEPEKAIQSASISDKARRPFERPWILMGVIALAALLRFYALGKDSLWYDEVLGVNICRGGLAAIFRASTTLGPINSHPPLYHLILYCWMHVFGQSDLALRSLSAFFGTLSVLLAYQVGTELFDRKTGLVAAFLLTISPFAIYYSQEVRPYSLLMLLTLASFLFFIRMLKTDRRHKTHLLGYCVTNVLLIYTHTYALFAVGSQVLYFLIFRYRYASSRRPFWIAQAVTALVALPWIYVLLSGVVKGTATQNLLRVEDQAGQIRDSLVFDLWGFWAGELALVVFPLSFFLFLAGLFRVSQSRIKILAGRPRTALLLLWIFGTLAGVTIFTLANHTVLWSRYLIGVVPAIYLVVARGLANITEAFRAHVARVNVNYILLALVVLLCLPQLLRMQIYPGREQWREVADLIQQESLPEDVILCPAGYDRPFNYYYKGDLEVLPYGVAADEGELAAFVGRATGGKERLWLIIMNYQGTIDAPIKGYLLARCGDTFILLQRDFSSSSVFLFDLQPVRHLQ